MAQTIAEDEVTTHGSDLTTTPPQIGSQPVTDIEAFLARLPKFTDEEVEALNKAIAEDRAERRAAAGVTL